MMLKTNSTAFLAVDPLAICEDDRSANKSLTLKCCLNAENSKFDERTTCIVELRCLDKRFGSMLLRLHLSDKTTHIIATVYRTFISVNADLSIFARSLCYVTSSFTIEDLNFILWFFPSFIFIIFFFLNSFSENWQNACRKYVIRFEDYAVGLWNSFRLYYFFLHKFIAPIPLVNYVIDDTRTSRQVNTRGCPRECVFGITLAVLLETLDNNCNPPASKCISPKSQFISPAP